MQNKNSKEREVLLKVEHLCQYFKMGPANELKAVDDVNFEIRKGEVFGLVGESGCGKTTTGRSIIRLYDITSGNIIFKGQRIGAGIRSYKDAIRNAKENYRRETAEIKAQMKADGSPDARLKGQKRLEAAERELSRTIAEQNENIRAAKEDQKHCNQKYAEEQAKKVRQLYEPCLARVRDAFDKCTDQDHTGTAAQNLLRVVEGAAEEVEKDRKSVV